jgi:hypothetical protein
LRSLQERLRAAYGDAASLRLHSGPHGFEAHFVIPFTDGEPAVERP